MPLTPLHLGSALILGYLLRFRIHWPTLIITSVIVDLEPLAVTLLDLGDYPYHGYLHTFASAIFLGSLVGMVMWLIKDRFSEIFNQLALTEQVNYTIGSHVIAGFSGWFLHVLLDSPLYPDIRPLYPLVANPLYNPGASREIIKVSICLTLVGVIIYLRHLYETIRGVENANSIF